MTISAEQYRAMMNKQPARNKSKFRRSAAESRTIDGITFASKAEAKRYSHLKIMQQRGEIRDLQQGQKYPLVVNGIEVGIYTPDFEYRTLTNGVVIEEVKAGTSGKETDYRLRRKLFEACTGLQVSEITVKV